MKILKKIKQWRDSEDNDKGRANISFIIRKNDADISYLGMDHMAKSIENKGNDGRNPSLVRDAINYKPVRNAVAHTGLLTDDAKEHLSVTFNNIKGRIRTLLKG